MIVSFSGHDMANDLLKILKMSTNKIHQINRKSTKKCHAHIPATRTSINAILCEYMDNFNGSAICSISDILKMSCLCRTDGAATLPSYAFQRIDGAL